MTDQPKLERIYRRLLACYPRAFRQENGEELLAVLLACAPHGQRRPGLAASADLIRSGLWMRLRPSVPRSARTVRAAVRMMYSGAAVTTVSLMFTVISLAFTGGGTASLRLLGRSQPLSVAVTVGIMGGLVLIALWLWMAQANGPGAELGAHPVYGSVRPGYAASFRQQRRRRGGVRGGYLADRLGRGVATLATHLQRIFQAAGQHSARSRRRAIGHVTLNPPR